MKPLVVYYSRTGNTKLIGDFIAEKTGADVEELKDLKNRSGFIGYIIAGMDAVLKKKTNIAPLTKNLNEYDPVFIGAPVWGWNLAPATRTYLAENADKLTGKNIYLFCTMGGSGDGKTFASMKELLKGAEVKKTISFTVTQLKNKDKVKKRISEFVPY